MDNGWTLFLDRDGVINYEKVDDYIHHWDEFNFYPGALEAIAALGKRFGRVIVVTNQKGIGKGVTIRENVEEIHANMTREIVAVGGRLDAIYYCPDTDFDSPCRKPNPGMAFQAKSDFPEIDLTKSLMVGNNLSDLSFGRNAGMRTVFLRTTKPQLILPENMADFEAPDLAALPGIISHCFTKGC